METCEVCCEKLTKPISCNFCSYVACYKCFSKYMIEMTLHAKCMKCEKPWTRKQLVDSFGQYFVSHKYKNKRQNVLFDLEKAMLPDTQPLAVRSKQIQELYKQIMVREKCVAVVQERISRNEFFDDSDENFEEYLKKRKELRMEMHSYKEDISNLNDKKNRLWNIPLKNQKKQNNILVIKCPKENCRGYTNCKTMICDICETKLCHDCHEITCENHTCNPDTVKSVKLISHDSRNCPSCKSVIHKIEGCDQMFCTQCHTAFSWTTGEISLGRIHNPHYYEYLRRTGCGEAPREIGDIPCGGLPRLTREILQNRYLSGVHQRVNHVELYEIPRLNTYVNNVNGNVDLRISYLNNHICLETFKSEIYKREKAREKKREILTILNTFVVVCSDIFRNRQPEQDCKTEFENIRKFTNETLEDVSRVYGCVVPVIDEYWEIKNLKFLIK